MSNQVNKLLFASTGCTNLSSGEKMGSMSSTRPPIGLDTFQVVLGGCVAETSAFTGPLLSFRTKAVLSSEREGVDSTWVEQTALSLFRGVVLDLERSRLFSGEASSLGVLFRFLSAAVSPLASVWAPISGLGRVRDDAEVGGGRRRYWRLQYPTMNKSVCLCCARTGHRRNFGGDPWKKLGWGSIVIAISTKAQSTRLRQRKPIKTPACRKRLKENLRLNTSAFHLTNPPQVSTTSLATPTRPSTSRPDSQVDNMIIPIRCFSCGKVRGAFRFAM
jgi:hypothetical protein